MFLQVLCYTGPWNLCQCWLWLGESESQILQCRRLGGGLKPEVRSHIKVGPAMGASWHLRSTPSSFLIWLCWFGHAWLWRFGTSNRGVRANGRSLCSKQTASFAFTVNLFTSLTFTGENPGPGQYDLRSFVANPFDKSVASVNHWAT